MSEFIPGYLSTGLPEDSDLCFSLRSFLTWAHHFSAPLSAVELLPRYAYITGAWNFTDLNRKQSPWRCGLFSLFGVSLLLEKMMFVTPPLLQGALEWNTANDAEVTYPTFDKISKHSTLTLDWFWTMSLAQKEKRPGEVFYLQNLSK